MLEKALKVNEEYKIAIREIKVNRAGRMLKRMRRLPVWMVQQGGCESRVRKGQLVLWNVSGGSGDGMPQAAKDMVRPAGAECGGGLLVVNGNVKSAQKWHLPGPGLESIGRR